MKPLSLSLALVVDETRQVFADCLPDYYRLNAANSGPNGLKRHGVRNDGEACAYQKSFSRHELLSGRNTSADFQELFDRN